MHLLFPNLREVSARDGGVETETESAVESDDHDVVAEERSAHVLSSIRRLSVSAVSHASWLAVDGSTSVSLS
jgi:hypothetical protein